MHSSAIGLHLERCGVKLCIEGVGKSEMGNLGDPSVILVTLSQFSQKAIPLAIYDSVPTGSWLKTTEFENKSYAMFNVHEGFFV